MDVCVRCVWYPTTCGTAGAEIKTPVVGAKGYDGSLSISLECEYSLAQHALPAAARPLTYNRHGGLVVKASTS